MRSPRALLPVLIVALAPLAGCLHTPAVKAGCAQDSSECKADLFGSAPLEPCHWHYFGLTIDPGTAFARAAAGPGPIEVPVALELYPVRWMSFRVGTGEELSPFWLGARLYQCDEESCGWFGSLSWEPARRRLDGSRGFVLSASGGYRFENHFVWKEWGGGVHLFASPALALDVLAPAADGSRSMPLAPRFQLELGWSF